MSVKDSVSLGKTAISTSILHHFPLEILDRSIRPVDLIVSVKGLCSPPDMTVNAYYEAVDRDRSSVITSETSLDVATSEVIISVLTSFEIAFCSFLAREQEEEI